MYLLVNLIRFISYCLVTLYPLKREKLVSNLKIAITMCNLYFLNTAFGTNHHDVMFEVGYIDVHELFMASDSFIIDATIFFLLIALDSFTASLLNFLDGDNVFLLQLQEAFFTDVICCWTKGLVVIHYLLIFISSCSL